MTDSGSAGMDDEVLYTPGEAAASEGGAIRDRLWRGMVHRMFLTNLSAFGVILIIYSPDLPYALHMLLLFLLILNIVIIPLYLYLMRVSLIVSLVQPPNLIITRGGILFGAYLLGPDEAPGITLMPVRDGLAFVIPAGGDGGGEPSGSGVSVVTVPGLSEADVREVRAALRKAGFMVAVRIVPDDGGEWRKGVGPAAPTVDLHIAILIAILLVALAKALSFGGIIFDQPDPGSLEMVLNLSGILLVLVTAAIHIPDRVSRWSGRRSAGALRDPRHIPASVQAHWADAMAMDALDRAGVMYERKVDTELGSVEPRRFIHLRGLESPHLSVLVTEAGAGGLSITVGAEKTGGDAAKLADSVAADIGGCLRNLERSVERRKKGEMIDFR